MIISYATVTPRKKKIKKISVSLNYFTKQQLHLEKKSKLIPNHFTKQRLLLEKKKKSKLKINAILNHFTMQQLYI